MADLTPLDLSDEDLDRLSEITEQDVVITNQFATRAVDEDFKNLLLTKDQGLEETATNANPS